MNKQLITLALAALCLLPACQPGVEEGSDLNYLLFDGYKGLIPTANESSVTICLDSMDHEEEVKRAATMWYMALGSNTVVNISTAGNCAASVSYRNLSGASHTEMGSRPKVNMNSGSQWFASFGVLVHEFGHAFGLKDTYDQSSGQSGVCVAGQPQDAVMCTPSVGEPRQDDINGVRDAAGLGSGGNMPNYDSMVLGGGTVSNIGMGQQNPGYNTLTGQPSITDIFSQLILMKQMNMKMNQLHCSQSLNATVVQKAGSADKNIAIVKAFAAENLWACIGDTATCSSPHAPRVPTQKILENNQEWFVTGAIDAQLQASLRSKAFQVNKAVPPIVTIEGMMGDPNFGMTVRTPFRCEAYISI